MKKIPFVMSFSFKLKRKLSIFDSVVSNIAHHPHTYTISYGNSTILSLFLFQIFWEQILPKMGTKDCPLQYLPYVTKSCFWTGNNYVPYTSLGAEEILPPQIPLNRLDRFNCLELACWEIGNKHEKKPEFLLFVDIYFQQFESSLESFVKFDFQCLWILNMQCMGILTCLNLF